MTGLHDACEQ